MIRHTRPHLGHVLHGLGIVACGLALSTALAGGGSAEEPPSQTATPPTNQSNPPVTATSEVDPSVVLQGSVWRTKAGIVFLKTPIGLLTLTSKTTLKDLKASQEVHFLVHERYSVVEIRKRTDGSLVHRYLSGPMTSGTDSPRTLRWWGLDGDQTVQV